MLKGSKQPRTAASGLLFYAAGNSNNDKHDRANLVFKKSLRTEIQPAKVMQIRKTMHASFLAQLYYVRHEFIKACSNWIRYAFTVSMENQSDVLLRNDQTQDMTPFWPISIPQLCESIPKTNTAEIYCFL